MTSGGKREGAGRPVTPDDERLNTIIRVRVTNDQATELAALKAAGHNTRDVLLAGIAALTPRRSRRTTTNLTQALSRAINKRTVVLFHTKSSVLGEVREFERHNRTSANKSP